ncbi:MAG: flagellar basal body-associated FliL family protein [Fidelibacterota bacterium]|nr:MAG: flagellar basal body-associated FliL family protein [Candidatus Neomarinimicrobiota bacterium]
MSEIEEQGVPLEEAEDLTEEDQAVKESKPLPPFVKLIILVAGVLILAGGAYFLTQKVVLPQIKKVPVMDKITEVKQKLQKPKREEDTSKEKKKKKKKGPVIKHPIMGITANIAGGRGRTFVAVDIMVEATSEDSRDEMLDKEYQIRDALIFYFRGRNLREIATREFQMSARDTVRSIINSILESEPVDTVFFTTFLIQ